MRTTFEDAKHIADAICKHKKTELTCLSWYPQAPNQWVASFSEETVVSFVSVDRDVSFERHLDDYEINKFFHEEEIDEPEAGKDDL